MYWSAVWCSGGCNWKWYKTFTFCSLLTRCTIPCAWHAKRHLNLQKWSNPLVFLTCWLRNVLRATTACTFSTSERPKVVRTPSVFNILTWKCALRHNGVHFFDISTSKSGPTLVCFAHFDLQMCFARQRRALFRHLNFQKWSYAGVFYTFWLASVLRATTACTFSTSQLPKVVRQWCVLYILTCKCASRHNGVHFFGISTSKSGPTLVCFVHFDLQVCFAPQRRALFRHLNFQKWSENGVLCTFWLRNVLRATTACTFSTSQLPKVVREWCALYILTCKCASRHMACTFSTSQLPKVVRHWCALYILTCKCASRHNGVHFFDISTSKSASRHNGVQFFISHLASWLRTRRFSEPTFRPSGATNHWKKHSVSRLSYLFSHLHLLSSYSFSSTLLSSNLSLLSASSLLCFSSVHIVGSLTSKLPSNI